MPSNLRVAAVEQYGEPAGDKMEDDGWVATPQGHAQVCIVSVILQVAQDV